MALTRVKDWVTELDTFLRSRTRTPFSYGTNDCCLFTADAIKVLTGTDLAASFRGKFHDEASAATIITANGGSVASLAASAATANGMAEVAPLMAQRGDWVALDGGDGMALGIVGLDGFIYGVGAKGLQRVPITHAQRAWRV